MIHKLKLRQQFMEENSFFGELFTINGANAKYTEWLEDTVGAYKMIIKGIRKSQEAKEVEPSATPNTESFQLPKLEECMTSFRKSSFYKNNHQHIDVYTMGAKAMYNIFYSLATKNIS